MTVWALNDICKHFSDTNSLAVNRVSLTIKEGERVGIIGKSGSGKSTLARVGLGLSPASSGRVHLFGEDTSAWTTAQWQQIRRHVQYLHQDPGQTLDPYLTVESFLTEALHQHNPTCPGNRVQTALSALGIERLFSRFPHQLSGGERRRVGIAKLMMATPQLVVTDELTSGLDAPRKIQTVTRLVSALPKTCAIVIITHDVPLVRWFADTIMTMDEGKLVEVFSATTRPTHPASLALYRASGLI